MHYMFCMYRPRKCVEMGEKVILPEKTLFYVVVIKNVAHTPALDIITVRAKVHFQWMHRNCDA